jgi:ABC-type polysaccharide/polyol phosphate export permease
LLDYRLVYSGSLLGFFWIHIQVLAWVGVVYVVFGRLIDNVEAFDFFLYTLIGAVFFTNFSYFISSAPDSLIKNRSALNHFDISVYEIYIRHACTHSISLLLLIPLIFIYCLINTYLFSFLHFVFSTILFLLLAGAASAMISALNAFIRDTRFLVQTSMRFLLFATPIFWVHDADSIGIRRLLVELNPIAWALSSTRSAFGFGNSIEHAELRIAAFIVVCLIGTWALSRLGSLRARLSNV